MTIDQVALWIGYAAMTVGGALWLAAEGCWRFWINSMNVGDIMDATEEWRRAHPEKFARWKKRNGIDQEDAS